MKRIFFTTLILSISLTINLISCKNHSKIPQVKYDLSELEKQDKINSTLNDTIIYLRFSGGNIRVVEHTYYLIKKLNKKTEIQRTSNFQKFKTLEIESSDFPWTFIFNNYDKLIQEKIATEKKVYTKDYVTIYKYSGTHGKTTSLTIKTDKVVNSIYLPPLIEDINEDNINIVLLKKIRSSVVDLNYTPCEKVKYKWDR